SSTDHFKLPSFFDKHSTSSLSPPGSRRAFPPLPPLPASGLAATACPASFFLDGDVTKIWSPQIIGVPPLHEGSSVFQTMFSFFSRLQVVGKFFESLIPFPVGPLHCGQFSFAPTDWAAKPTRQPTTK